MTPLPGSCIESWTDNHGFGCPDTHYCRRDIYNNSSYCKRHYHEHRQADLAAEAVKLQQQLNSLKINTADMILADSTLTKLTISKIKGQLIKIRVTKNKLDQALAKSRRCRELLKEIPEVQF